MAMLEVMRSLEACASFGVFVLRVGLAVFLAMEAVNASTPRSFISLLLMVGSGLICCGAVLCGGRCFLVVSVS